MVFLRLFALILHLLRGLATCALIFPFTDDTQRAGHIQRWSRTLLRLCRVELHVHNETAAIDVPRALIVANHISWLDIFVINATQPCRFVAKAEIRSWPLIGWLVEQAGTIFIARGKLRDVRKIYEGVVHSLQAGDHVAFFPEGTVSLQGTLLPFHANLFEAAIEAQVPIQPFALRYLNEKGEAHPSVRYVEPITFIQSVWMILNGNRIIAELRCLPAFPVSAQAHRRELATQARTAIAAALSVAHWRQ